MSRRARRASASARVGIVSEVKGGPCSDAEFVVPPAAALVDCLANDCSESRSRKHDRLPAYRAVVGSPGRNDEVMSSLHVDHLEVACSSHNVMN